MPSRPRTSVIAVAVVVASLLAACTTTTGGHGGRSSPTTSTAPASTGRGTPTSPGRPQTVDFSNCAGLFNLSAAGIPDQRRAKLHFDCGRLQVPIDYSHPGGATISIEILRVHYDEQPDRIGSLIVNPGGPGGSGVFLAISLAASLSEDVLEHFDIVGFDPRGVGLSSPIKCQTDRQETQALAFHADVRTAAGMRAAKRQAATFAHSCEKKYGPALAHFNTVETARDMDRIRAAVGDAKLNYLGFSYGTELGAIYAHLYPQRIQAAVLDGAVDPRTTGRAIASNEQQLAGFESAFDQFAADCVKRPACAKIGNPRHAVAALQKRANAKPIPTSDHDDTRRATGGDVLYAVLAALYSQQLWPQLGTAIVEAQHGDAKGVFDLVDTYSERNSDGHYSNLLDVFQVVGCNDQKIDPSDAVIKRTAAKWAKRYPLFGLWSAPSLFQCQAWQNQRHPVPPETAPGSKPILVVGNVLDPATPYAGAVHLARSLGSGVLLTWNGEGHTSYGQSACIDSKVNAYLIDGTVPAPHTTCTR